MTEQEDPVRSAERQVVQQRFTLENVDRHAAQPTRLDGAEQREMVDDPRIKKTKINARQFFQTLAEIQFESGYPYIMLRTR